MTLEQIVLPLEQSRSLVERGIVLDTALVSFHYGNTEHWGLVTREDALQYARMNSDNDIPRPVLSELLDAIRAKVGKATDETTVILSRDGSEAGASCAGVRTEGAKYEIAQAVTDLLAAYALLMEVTA